MRITVLVIKSLSSAVLTSVSVRQMWSQSATSSDVPEANPARPTISTQATLTPVGHLQFENGALYATTSPEFLKRLGVEQVTKLTLADRLQAIALFEPSTHSVGAEVSGNRPGEVFAGVQGMLLKGEGKRPIISMQYQKWLYASPAPELNLGTYLQNATLLLSDDLAGFHFDLNGLVLEQQSDTTHVRRAQIAQTLATSHPVGRVTVSSEFWHYSQPLTKSNAVGTLWSGSYPLHKNLVFDAGFDRGLTKNSTRWETFAGFTYLLPHRLW
jgi:hypothetical protein